MRDYNGCTELATIDPQTSMGPQVGLIAYQSYQPSATNQN